MSASIFVISSDGDLLQLQRSDYGSEDLLQRLLAAHPSVLGVTGGDEQLLLVKREHEVPDGEGGTGRWLLDHLFLDRNAVPVLVEVKRASDTRIRREVVAQMLDYAANGVTHWPLPQLIDAFEQTAAAAGQDPDALLSALLGEDGDPEAFWRQVEANLRSGRIRMVFVADRVPKELRRIVEFLNEQMRPAEVLAVEVEHYLGRDGTRTLVPRLVGVTERAQSNKAVADATERLTLDEWLTRFRERHGSEAREGAERALEWFRKKGCLIGVSRTQDSVPVGVPTDDGKKAWPFFVRSSSGRIETSLQFLKYRSAFASDDARRQLLEQLRALPGVAITTQKLSGWPAFPVSDLLRGDLWDRFTELAGRIINQAKAPPTGSEPPRLEDDGSAL